MKFLLVVSVIRILTQVLTSKVNKKRKEPEPENAAPVQHPAAFELR